MSCELLEKKFPEIFKEFQSTQGELSVELLKVRISANLNVQKTSELLDMESDEYLKYEFGDVSISVKKYDEIIGKLKKRLNEDDVYPIDNYKNHSIK
ncbi:TPA: hypothetical protein IZ324_002139 [Enterococcus faecium]|uniref:hypothetical protein n=1 Tax=Enterococcus faecium TaxID=1352 RepID=UPI000CF32276|nr:hypothetical protein [Enterococcus faecium]EGP5042398.1 hypothetical protein [Enterococcus faecium]PQG87846.1 hypothetical protein CUS53_02360 [Enterococcus faecium]PQH05613.1 hypothetical protein CUS45_04765 [Enterococcus faecium]HAP8158137.1 hypothetical protein [Enterococcus faecium]HAR1346891.1 hypothetical protein [Enterococcus faecium]